jgi:hypothetical protein
MSPVLIAARPDAGQRPPYPIMPSPLIRSALTLFDWAIAKKAEDAQRRELRLPKATVPASRRMAGERPTGVSSPVTPRGTPQQSNIPTDVDLRVVHGIRAGA